LTKIRINEVGGWLDLLGIHEINILFLFRRATNELGLLSVRQSQIMKNLFIAFILFPCVSNAQDSVSVLFIGNSYTYVNDLPSMVSNLTVSLGDELTFDSKTNGGYTFLQHSNDPLTYSKIESKPWDFVVLQGQSQEPSFPYEQVNQQTLPYALELADSVYSNRYCSQPMYFMTWGRENGDPQWDSIATFNGMNSRLRNAYLRIADSAEACVSPVGSAWRYVRDNHPGIQLYSGDGSHPSLAGSYLAACTFYSSLFRKSPEGATYTAGLDAGTAGILQEIAAITVLDSLDLWRLRPNNETAIADFSFSVSGGTVTFNNESWRGQDFSWSFGDGEVSNVGSPVHTYSIPGSYEVMLITSNECGEDTLTQLITIEPGNLNVSEMNMPLIKRQESGFKLFFQSVPQSFVLFTADGKMIRQSADQNVEQVNIDLSDQPSGVYFLLVHCEGGELHIKLAW